jgi:hypothetical protein
MKGERQPENAAREGWRRILQHGMEVLLEPVQQRLNMHFAVADYDTGVGIARDGLNRQLGPSPTPRYNRRANVG